MIGILGEGGTIGSGGILRPNRGILGGGGILAAGDSAAFDPRTILGLSLWLDPNALTGAEDSTVTSIPDSSGSGNSTTSISGTWLTKRDRRGDGKTWVRVPSGYQETPSKAHFPSKRGTMFVIYEPAANVGTQVIAGTFYSGGAGSSNCLNLYANQPADIKAFVNGTQINGGLNFDVAGIPRILGVRRKSDTLFEVWKGPTRESNSTISGTQFLTARLKIGGNFGAGTGINGYLGPILEYDRALTDAEMRTVIEGLSRDWLGGRPVQVSCIGNSLTSGSGSTGAFGSYPNQLIALLGARYVPFVFANAGFTTPQVDAAGGAAADTALTNTVSRSVAVVWEIGNDILANTAEATVKSNFVSLVANRRTAGFTKVIALTVPPRSDLTAGKETMRQSVNTWLLAGNSGADVVADVGSIAELQNTANGTYFVDGVHYTNAGYAKVATVVDAAIKSLHL